MTNYFGEMKLEISTRMTIEVKILNEGDFRTDLKIQNGGPAHGKW